MSNFGKNVVVEPGWSLNRDLGYSVRRTMALGRIELFAILPAKEAF
jgi:hypothetical protein